MYKWCHESRRNYTFVKLKATKISKRCVLFWSRGPDGYRKNDRKRAVVWPWLVLEVSTVLALTQLGIQQSDWRRVGIRSTNLHIVVEYATTHLPGYLCSWTFSLNIGLNMLPSHSFMPCLDNLLGYFTGEFQALQLIVIAVFGAVD